MAMNLGAANLKQVNKNRPELVHSSSQHSITASDHFYSASEKSSASSADDRTTVIRYHTPVERVAFANEAPASGSTKNLSSSHLSPLSEVETPPRATGLEAVAEQSPPRAVQLPPVEQRPVVDRPLPGAYPEDRSDTPVYRLPPTVHYKPAAPAYEQPAVSATTGKQPAPATEEKQDTTQISRKAVGSADMSQWQGAQARRAHTPGVDDTPYIHFAIDQLTRDEELLGRSRDPSGSPEMTPTGIGPSVSPLSFHDDELRHPLAQDDDIRAITPLEAVHKSPLRSPSISPLSHQEIQEEQVQHHGPPPQYPPTDMYRYPPLNFLPASLRLPAISILSLVCLIYIALLVLSVVWSAKHKGLWLYDGVGTGKYFLAEYLPQLLAALLLIYTQVVQAALQRVLPFVLLAQQSASSNRDVLTTIPLFITNFLTPNGSLLRSGRLSLQYASISFWLTLFTVPLASALFQTRLYTSEPWRWATVEPVGIILVAIYINLIIALFSLSIGLSRGSTGLKWDPVSLADILVLLRRSSLAGAESPMNELFRPDRASLGYWQSSSQPGDFYHGIGQHSSTTRLQVDRGKAVVRTSQLPPHVSTFESWRSTTKHSIRPRFLRETYLMLYAAIALVLMIAFLVATYVHNSLMFGFSPLLATATPATASFTSFSPSNFLYSFIPALIALFQPLLWASLDTSARFLAPFLALVRAGPKGVPAEASVLLPYAADPPLVATIRAKSHGHIVVTASSALGLLSWALPVIGGGIFTAQFVEGSTGQGQIVIRADPAGLGALTTFVVLCGLGWISAWPVARIALQGSLRGGSRTRRRRAVRRQDAEKGAGKPTSIEEWLGATDIRYLAGIREAVGEAILASRVWREPRTREDLVGRLVGRGRGRWSWDGSQGSGGGAVQRFDV